MRKSRNKHDRGFTLMELLISFALVAIIGVVVFTSQREFEKSVDFNRVAIDVANDIRLLQVQAISTIENPRKAGDYNPRLGAHFMFEGAGSWCSPDCASDRYVLFAEDVSEAETVATKPWYFDAQKKCGPGDSECYELKILPEGYEFTDFCVSNLESSLPSGHGESAVPVCTSKANPSPANIYRQLDIIFQRPSPVAHFSLINPDEPDIDDYDCDDNDDLWACVTSTSAYLVLRSPEGHQKIIHIQESGQVWIEDV